MSGIAVTAWFISMWYFFAAAISVLMLLHFLQRPSAPDVSTLAATRLETEKRAIWS